MTLPRVQHLLWITLSSAVLCSVALLGFRIYVDPYSSRWDFSLSAAISAALTSLSLLLALAFGFGRWSAKFFALGFVLGAAVENRALDYYAKHDLLRLTTVT